MKFSIVALVALSVATGAAASERPAAGQALYRSRCGMCHQEGGFGANTLAERLGKGLSILEQRTDLDPTLVRQVVRRGIGSMPAITKVELTDEELGTIADYLARR